MTNALVLLGFAASMLLTTDQTQKPGNPDVAQMTLTGCLRSSPADPNNAADTRVVYTLEVADAAAATGTGGSPGREPKHVQLSPTDAKALAKLVGQEVQVRGELLQPPGLPPGAAGQTPLPRDSEGTFRVSSVKQIASKCRAER